MDIPVLIQPTRGGGFLARAGSPFDWTAEGATAEEALQNLYLVATKRVADGDTIASIPAPEKTDPLSALRAKGMLVEPPPGTHPLLQWAGTLDLNDPMVQEWQQAVNDYRRQLDEECQVQ